jgi:transposase
MLLLAEPSLGCWFHGSQILGPAHWALCLRQPVRPLAGATAPDRVVWNCGCGSSGLLLDLTIRCPSNGGNSNSSGTKILFWDESDFRADAVHGKTWAPRGQMPVIERHGQHQNISAASAVSAKKTFWFTTYASGLTGELFVELLKKLIHQRKKPVRLVIDGLPTHKKALVKDYVASTAGKLTLHFLPGYAADLNPDEMISSHAKRTTVAHSPQASEKLQCRVNAQLQDMTNDLALVKSFFRHPSVFYIANL